MTQRFSSKNKEGVGELEESPDLLADNERLRAVNAELVAALESVERRASNAPNDDPGMAEREFTRIMHIARAALAKAKELP